METEPLTMKVYIDYYKYIYVCKCQISASLSVRLLLLLSNKSVVFFSEFVAMMTGNLFKMS